MGSSGGGGGGSGKIDFPSYMKDWHSAWLGSNTGITVSLTSAMENALTNVNPYASYVTTSANTILFGGTKQITNYPYAFDLLQTYEETNFETIFNAFPKKVGNNLKDVLDNTNLAMVPTYINSYIDEANAKIDAIMSAERNVLNDEMQAQINELEISLRDINAAMGSTLQISKAILMNKVLQEIARTDANLRLEAFKQLPEMTAKADDFVLRSKLESFRLRGELASRLDDFTLRADAFASDYATKVVLAKRDIATTALDAARLYGAMNVEIEDNALETRAKDALWDLKIFQYGGNFLGSIAGSAVGTDRGDKNKIMATASGAMSGAAMGAMVGSAVGNPVIGAALGAVVGGLGGLLG